MMKSCIVVARRGMLKMHMQINGSRSWQQTFLVPSEAARYVLSNLGVQISSRHGLHDHQSLLGVDAGTQEGDDIRVATSLEDHYLLDETLLLGRSGTPHHLDCHIRGTK